ncbi:MAG: hypothetical protein H6993_13220 [Pseudomonadales bacterium]|nr:hypothetical protein [Pseudomonadales bacterium]MCP5184920.1 hypothetical protein [Pseudomonadales bacterium]
MSIRLWQLVVPMVLMLLPDGDVWAGDAVFDREWLRLTTPRLELITDLDRASATVLLGRLNRFEEVVGHLLADEQLSATRNARVKLLVFSRRRDYQAVFATRGFAGFLLATLREDVLIVGPDLGGQHLVENAMHEYAHFLLRHHGSALHPLWYEEGFASLLSSLVLDGDSVLLGDRNKHDAATLHFADRDGRFINDAVSHVRARYVYSASSVDTQGTSLAFLVRVTSLDDVERDAVGDFYSRAWLLLHLCRLGHLAGFPDRRAALDDYLHRIGNGAESEAAFAAAFSEGFHAVERDLETYAKRVELPTLRFAVARSVSAERPTAAQLNATDLAFELGLVSAEMNPRFAARAFRRVGKGAAGDARAVVGRAILHRQQGRLRNALAEARVALSMDGTAPLNRLILADVLLESCPANRSVVCRMQRREAQTLYQQVVDAYPERRDALFGLGVSCFLLGDNECALVHLQTAHVLAPWAPRISLFLGEALRLAGDSVASERHLRRAARWEQDAVWRRKAVHALALVPERALTDHDSGLGSPGEGQGPPEKAGPLDGDLRGFKSDDERNRTNLES